MLGIGVVGSYKVSKSFDKKSRGIIFDPSLVLVAREIAMAIVFEASWGGGVRGLQNLQLTFLGFKMKMKSRQK